MMTDLKTVFGIDLRSLVLFRFMIGLYVAADVLNRWPYLKVFYTDAGVLTRTEALFHNDPARWSLLYLSGLPFVIHILFAVLLIAALCLMLGYRTKLANFICWLLLVSVVNRNLFVLQGGDALACLLLFWGLFLPLGARCSVDDAMRADHTAPSPSQSDRPHGYISVATVAALAQVSYVYFFGALLKDGPDWTETFQAVYYATALDSVSSVFGEMLSRQSWLIVPMTKYVYWLEWLMPVYMFTPLFFKPLRLIGFFLLVLLHLGFVVFLNVGLFPLVSIASLTLLFPGYAWDWLARHMPAHGHAGQWTLFYDEDCGFCRKTCLLLRSFALPYRTRILPAQPDPVAGPILQEHNSWVVQTPDGALETKWTAVCLVLKQSPVTWPLGFAATVLPATLGRRLYEAIGDRRGALGRLTRIFLPYRAVGTRLPTPIAAFVVVTALFVFVWNLDRDDSIDLELPKEATSIAKFLRIHQRWDMFAPNPAKREGWFAFEGTFADGFKVDLWTGEPGYAPITAPDNIRAWNKDYRWRKYLNLIHKRVYKKQRKNLARYWCAQTWTDRNGNPARIRRVNMTFYARYTQPDNQPDTYREFKLYNAPCKESR